MAATPVKNGTTDTQDQAYFDAGSPNPSPFAKQDSPGYSMDVLSPGRQMLATDSLPPGTHVLLCFIAETTPACRMRSWACTRSSPSRSSGCGAPQHRLRGSVHIRGTRPPAE